MKCAADEPACGVLRFPGYAAPGYKDTEIQRDSIQAREKTAERHHLERQTISDEYRV